MLSHPVEPAWRQALVGAQMLFVAFGEIGRAHV